MKNSSGMINCNNKRDIAETKFYCDSNERKRRAKKFKFYRSLFLFATISLGVVFYFGRL